ncbi:MAG: hypothetical protein Q7R30_11360 [Acidobacteriota bacterium]|nr:hypothetical protein [Acidobacteriota bacterium]
MRTLDRKDPLLVDNQQGHLGVDRIRLPLQDRQQRKPRWTPRAAHLSRHLHPAGFISATGWHGWPESSRHRNVVGSVERGERDIGITALGQLAGALGVSLAAFFAPFRARQRRE